MPALRFWGRSAAAVLLSSGFIPAVAAADAAWFGPACNASPVNVVPVGAEQMLVSVRTGPREPDESDSVLRTADGELWVAPESLRRWRAPVPKKRMQFEAQQWAPLREVAHLVYRFDDCTQTLWVDVASATRTVTRLDLLPDAGAPEGSVQIEPGGYLNLDTQLLKASGSTRWAGLGELGVFNQWGYGANSFIANQDKLIRLDTAWSVDDPSSLHRLLLGDTITRSSSFGQAVRIGGIQWGRQFSLRPDIITYPLPSFSGSAALASSVDVYVNQSLRSNQDVPSGPFELNRVPVVAGSGEVQLVVRDVLGREQVLQVPFYAAPILLRDGLTDYTVEAGWQRNNYSVTSADYGRFQLAGTYRQGLSDTFTLETHAEVLHEQELLAFSGAWLQPSLGVFTAGFAGSGTIAGLGGSLQLGFERISRGWSFTAEARRSTPRFVRAGDGLDSVKSSDLARIGFTPHVNGSLSLSYLRQNRQSSGSVAILGLTYSYSFARDWNLFVNATQATSQSRDYSTYAGLNWQFGQGLLASAEYTHDQAGNLGRATVQRSMQNALDYSWRASAETGANGRRDVGGVWAQERGTLTADGERFAGDNSYRLGYSTGVAVLGKDAFWTRPVSGSFAVVDAQGVPDVRIYANEQPTGRTDSDGKLLVPNLRTYETTYLRIEDSDVPIEYEMSDLRQPIFLPTRGGAHAHFSVRALDGLTVRLHQSDGTPVPVGAQVFVPGMDQSLPVGFEGQAYLGQPVKGSRLDVRWPGHSCVARWPADASGTVDALCQESFR